ncbi:hypothetical protein O181_006615 [Austropuccinia psidii MF-1]|uniref:Ubiquinone biosynthesis monooxygenase COQ6, mitochondrial n=1 Tax=Austropuccinia psidii MF-1 TaxID=1389203 RepID=A0A9Q3GH15_9BASI|nr:hypothetical protein [Austropuccinia psidii MF-1]
MSNLSLLRRTSLQLSFCSFTRPASSLVHRRFYTNSQAAESSSVRLQVSDAIDYDIVIVGGGVVGLALANALATCRILNESGHRISILDASELSKIKNWDLPYGSWSNRVSSVTNENLKFLEDIGVWRYIDEQRTNPIERMQVWDGLSDARIVFDSVDGSDLASLDSSAIPQMGRFVENTHLQKAMLQNLDNYPSVDVYGSTKVAHISADEANWPMITTADGKTLRTRLLVGADGFSSPVKSYSKITSTGWNYDAHCVVGTLELQPTAFNYTAWQRFLTTGPLGLLPLSDQHASLAWSTKPNIAAGLKALDGPTLASTINACFQLPHESVTYILSRIASHSKSTPVNGVEIQSEIDWRSSSPVYSPSAITADELPPKVVRARMDTIASFPLRMFHADQYLGTPAASEDKSTGVSTFPTRTVLVGDAAHVLHPMAGQGLNLGLGDAKQLAKVVRVAVENGHDIGGLTALAPYARSRYMANHLVMSTVDKLNKLYSLDASPVVWARSVGVEVLNEIPSLKALMMGKAGGNGPGGPQKIGETGFWSTVANVYEASEKAKILVEGLASIAMGALRSTLHRASAPKQ